MEHKPIPKKAYTLALRHAGSDYIPVKDISNILIDCVGEFARKASTNPELNESLTEPIVISERVLSKLANEAIESVGFESVKKYVPEDFDEVTIYIPSLLPQKEKEAIALKIETKFYEEYKKFIIGKIPRH